ncbi:hypothetical protein [Pseudohongiella nitratireducens]
MNDRIMPGIIEASRYSLMDEATVVTIAEQVNNDLQSLSLQSWLGTLSSCELQLRAIENTAIASAPANHGFSQHLQVTHQTGQQDALSASLSASFTLDCLVAPGPVLSMSFLFAAFVTALIAGLPRAYSPQQRQLLNVLSDVGLEWQDIQTVLTHLQKNDTASLQWYDFLIQRIQSGSLSVEQLMQSANASDCIQFHHDRQSVSIRGIEVPLSRTPYFYYALYAHQRHDDAQRNFSACDDNGWILNPASGRANPEHTRLLLNLMKTHDGHQKAIKELEAHGVRAKTMDQNRNKVKEELIKVLGESVAEQYLFETRRDSRTGRNHYRLKTSATKIILPLL